jgi:hypothetical protein
MKLNFVDSMDEVLKIALERELVAIADARLLGSPVAGAGNKLHYN